MGKGIFYVCDGCRRDGKGQRTYEKPQSVKSGISYLFLPQP